MNATRISNASIKIPNATATTVMEPLMTGPTFTVIKMIAIKLKIAACPAIILAKRRIISANGFVKIPKNSIKGIIGTGAFNQVGTSGQNISFQYSFVPKILVNKNVITASTSVMAILPVTFAPPGKIGINPIRLFTSTKKNAVSK